MKIRADFVTNSSSVSFLLTMKKDIADIMLTKYGQSGYNQLGRFLKQQIETKGSKINIKGTELYSLPVKFRADGDVADLACYKKDGSFYDANFSRLSEDELWTIIHAFILEGEITGLGFGATMIETY